MPVNTEEINAVESNAATRNGLIKNVVIGLLVLIIVVGGIAWFLRGRSARVAMSTPYQAVLLSNGSAYFGQLEGLGTPFPVLRDVFYVQSTQNPETKQVSNILVKRGKEWHSPDRMILNSNMIVLVEPVNPTSRVAQLISQAKNQ